MTAVKEFCSLLVDYLRENVRLPKPTQLVLHVGVQVLIFLLFVYIVWIRIDGFSVFELLAGVAFGALCALFIFVVLRMRASEHSRNN